MKIFRQTMILMHTNVHIHKKFKIFFVSFCSVCSGILNNQSVPRMSNSKQYLNVYLRTIKWQHLIKVYRLSSFTAENIQTLDLFKSKLAIT